MIVWGSKSNSSNTYVKKGPTPKLTLQAFNVNIETWSVFTRVLMLGLHRMIDTKTTLPQPKIIPIIAKYKPYHTSNKERKIWNHIKCIRNTWNIIKKNTVRVIDKHPTNTKEAGTVISWIKFTPTYPNVPFTKMMDGEVMGSAHRCASKSLKKIYFYKHLRCVRIYRKQKHIYKVIHVGKRI